MLTAKRDDVLLKGELSGARCSALLLYLHMQDLFDDLLAEIYQNWKQNERIPYIGNCGVVVLLRKYPNKGDQIDNFRSITLLTVYNSDCKA